MNHLLAALAGVVVFCLSACGEPRRFGDTGGTPVTINAQVERSFFNNMENRQGRPSAGAGVGFGSGGHTGVGVGVGFSFSSTQVYLLGGDAIGQGNVFVKEVKWGANSFTVPLVAGRTLHLTVSAEGGRRGWEALGTITVPAKDPTVTLVLNADGTKLTVTPATAAPAAPPAAAPTTAPQSTTTPAPATAPAPTTAPAPAAAPATETPAATPAPATPPAAAPATETPAATPAP